MDVKEDNQKAEDKEPLIDFVPSKKMVVDHFATYSVRVKAEYILPHSLTPSIDTDAAPQTSDRGDWVTTENLNSSSSSPAAVITSTKKLLSSSSSSSNNTKNKSNQKRRSRDEKVDSSMKLCHAIVQGRECTYGDNCKYSHDMKEVLATRVPDINPDIPIPICPIYQSKGYCPFGIHCRVGSSSHVNIATGQNFTSTTMSSTDDDNNITVLNVLSKDTQTLLRKKLYPFQYVRKTGKNNNITNNNNGKQNNNNLQKIEIQSLNQSTMDHVADNAKVVELNMENSKETANDGDIGMSNKTTSLEFPQKEMNDPTCAMSSNPIAANNTSNKTSSSLSSTTSHHSYDPTTPAEYKIRKVIDFRNKVYVAPLTTVGNLPFRRVMKKFGADITCGEMALCLNLLQGQASEWALIKRHTDEDIFGIQLAAGYADLFIHTAELIEKENIQVDFVDMNLGCPLDLICDKGAGAKLMQRDSILRDTVEGMTQTLSCPVTIKMRTGWDEKNPFAHKLVHKIHSWGISGIGAIMIHGRSRLQRYSKLADWNYIQQVASSRPLQENLIPIIGNGDIFSYTDWEEKVSREGIECTAMLARGALIKPWLPTEIKERRHWDISASERLDMLRDFVRFGLEHWGTDTQGINNTRRFLLEWQSFLYRYVPVGMLEVLPQVMNHRPPLNMCGRSDLETLMLSKDCKDWIRISEMLLGKVPDGFHFEPKHKANSYATTISE